jgi:hypothetical protein
MTILCKGCGIYISGVPEIQIPHCTLAEVDGIENFPANRDVDFSTLESLFPLPLWEREQTCETLATGTSKKSNKCSLMP